MRTNMRDGWHASHLESGPAANKLWRFQRGCVDWKSDGDILTAHELCVFADDGVCIRCNYRSCVDGLRRVCAPITTTGESHSFAVVEPPTLADLEDLSNNATDAIGFENFAPVSVDPPASGPGTELSRLLHKFGISPTPTCSCRAKAAEMDSWGTDECERPERIDEVVAVMRTEAAARGLPFLDAAGRMLVRRAIANARRQEARRASQEAREVDPPAV